MAITDKKTGVWGLDQTFNKINQGSIWTYSGTIQLKGTGRNNEGQLGLNDTTQRSSPTQVPGTWDANIASNTYSTIATKSDNTFWAWGKNDYGQLGQNNKTNYSSPVQVPGSTWPTVEGQITLAADSTLAIKTDGSLWTWGNNETYNAGKLGHNNTTLYSSPKQVGSDTTWSSVCGGDRCNHAIKTDGTLWSWGSNAYGTFGTNQFAAPIASDGSTTKRSSPVQVPGTTWSKMPHRAYLSRYAIKTDGTLWAWGTGGWGTLGQNNTTQYSSPVQVGSDTTWSKFHVGDARTRIAVIKTDNTLWMWGTNGEGELGQNSTAVAAYSSPIQIPGSWDVISMSYKASHGIKTDGTLWTWGRNSYGGLGLNNAGNPTRLSSPTQIPGSWTNARGALQGTFLFENA